MPTIRQTFTGTTEEDFPEPPIARRLQPGDVVEYEADAPVEHARLEPIEARKPRKPDVPAIDDLKE